MPCWTKTLKKSITTGYSKLWWATLNLSQNSLKVWQQKTPKPIQKWHVLATLTNPEGQTFTQYLKFMTRDIYERCSNTSFESQIFNKLYGVGPVDNRPSTDKLHHFVKKEKKKKLHVTCDTWHVTHDMWHVTRDTWHVTHDTQHVTCCGGWTFSQNFSSLALLVCDLWYFED